MVHAVRRNLHAEIAQTTINWPQLRTLRSKAWYKGRHPYLHIGVKGWVSNAKCANSIASALPVRSHGNGGLNCINTRMLYIISVWDHTIQQAEGSEVNHVLPTTICYEGIYKRMPFYQQFPMVPNTLHFKMFTVKTICS